MKLHHVGVAVKDLGAAIKRYEAMGMRLAHREIVASQNVEVAFMGPGPWVELVTGTHPESAVTQFLERKGEGQHHVAIAVPDVAAELERQFAAGAKLIDRSPRPGAWGHKVAFLHPKDQGGVLIELVEEAH